jgi:hypothetical protein
MVVAHRVVNHVIKVLVQDGVDGVGGGGCGEEDPADETKHVLEERQRDQTSARGQDSHPRLRPQASFHQILFSIFKPIIKFKILTPPCDLTSLFEYTCKLSISYKYK